MYMLDHDVIGKGKFSSKLFKSITTIKCIKNQTVTIVQDKPNT